MLIGEDEVLRISKYNAAMILGPEEQPVTAVPEKLPGPREKPADPGERLDGAAMPALVRPNPMVQLPVMSETAARNPKAD